MRRLGGFCQTALRGRHQTIFQNESTCLFPHQFICCTRELHNEGNDPFKFISTCLLFVDEMRAAPHRFMRKWLWSELRGKKSVFILGFSFSGTSCRFLHPLFYLCGLSSLVEMPPRRRTVQIWPKGAAQNDAVTLRFYHWVIFL